MLFPEIPEAAVWAIYLLPVASFVAIVLSLRVLPRSFGGVAIDAGVITIGAVGISWLLALWALDTSLDLDGEAVGFLPHEWVHIFDLEVLLGVRLDGLTAVMLVVVTSVSLLVQVYSTGYMHGDTGYARYFAYMSLFTAAMLGLVVSSSLLQLFVHWELVGLSSYLLIGFWFHKPSAAAAAKKAFIVTRFGDFGFMLAVLLIWSKAGTFDIAEINHLALEGAPALTSAVLAGFTLGLLAGAVGKSAQFPLHIWLPDAMEGPTPVSALIHAATMVVAGVYLIARFFPSFEAAPSEVTSTVAYIGGFTALFAATMGIVATDIKRVLAYSTISQLGYMVMALGLGGYVAAIFHLFTHAFFKALLFLGSGSVNHATNTFDMRRMGGLRLTMPITFWTFLIAALSLSGVFPLAGFWSKDEILLDAWKHNALLFWVGAAVAGMTAFYMFRAIFLTFLGDYRGGEEPEDAGHGTDPAQPHESPRSMWVPLAILAVPAAVIGWVNIGGGFGELVEGALPADMRHFEAEVDAFVLVVSTLFALAGIGLAAAIYFYRQPAAETVRQRLGPVHTLVEQKYYLDVVAETWIVRGVLNAGVGGVLRVFDTYIVDGIANGVGLATRRAGDVARRVETGQLQAYTSLFLVGVVVATVVLFGVSGDQLDRLRDWVGV